MQLRMVENQTSYKVIEKIKIDRKNGTTKNSLV